MRLSKEMRGFALEAGFDNQKIGLMFEMYRDHHTAQRIYSLDWTETWCSWVNREVTIVNAQHDKARRQAYHQCRL